MLNKQNKIKQIPSHYPLPIVAFFTQEIDFYDRLWHIDSSGLFISVDLVFLIPSFHFPRARAEVFLHVQSLDPFETTKWFQKNSSPWFLAFAIQMHLHLTKLIHCEKEVPSCSNYKLFSMLSERASNVSSSVSFLVSQFKLSLWNLTILLNQHES